MPETNYKLYTAKQVRGMDNAAINDFGIAGYELMCRAGKAVVTAAADRYASASRWLVLCGPGNNGGDGYVVARLAAAAGINVTLCSLTDPGNLHGDAATAFADWQSGGGEVLSWPLPDGLSFDLAVDAMLGTGITRDVDGSFRQAIRYLNHLECPKIAIDIPSGLNADTGNVMGDCAIAESTVTFVGRKRGMYTASGADCCGEITFDDLGIPSEADRNPARSTGQLLHRSYLSGIIKPRLLNSHKGSYGHVLGVGGTPGMSGAIRLCGEAALRSGAGRVTIATDPGHAGLVNAGRPELMVRGVADKGALQFLLDEDHVIAVGPGLGRSAWSESLLQVCLAADASLVVDADGLNLLAEMHQPEQGHAGKQWILTPHPAEAGRLLNIDAAEVQLDRVATAQRLAEQYHAHVVLKGSGTVIATPGGEYAICPYGNPGMATAGTGDVLTGIIAALLAQGLTCQEAANGGVLAHALAGDIAARRVGEVAMLAGDITDSLHMVWMDATDPVGVE